MVFNVFFLFYPCQVADLSMGDLLLHCTVVWINPPGSLLKGKKEPELAAFGRSENILHKYRQILY